MVSLSRQWVVEQLGGEVDCTHDSDGVDGLGLQDDLECCELGSSLIASNYYRGRTEYIKSESIDPLLEWFRYLSGATESNTAPRPNNNFLSAVIVFPRKRQEKQ